RPTITVWIAGKGPYHLAFDTGASGSAIDSSLAAQLRLDVVGRARLASPGGAATETDIVSAPQVTMGHAELSNVPFTVAPLRARSIPIDGVLSYRALGDVLIKLDLTGASMVLSKQALDAGTPGVTHYDLDRGLIELPVVVAGRRLTVHVDTGSPS